MSVRYPKDLAQVLYESLGRPTVPSLLRLNELVETLYFASLRTEEGEGIRCAVTYLNKNDYQPLLTWPEEVGNSDRWQATEFDHPIALNVRSLVKLSKAADPLFTTLAVQDNETVLEIWGVTDQEVQYYRFLARESDVGTRHPGLFHVIINGPGSLSLFKDVQLVATLNQSDLVVNFYRVLQTGPLFKKLSWFVNDVMEVLDSHSPGDAHRHSLVGHAYMDSISRILLRIQRYRHGGSIVISPRPRQDLLNIKYPIKYVRLPKSILAYADYRLGYWNEGDEIEELSDADEPIPADLYRRTSMGMECIREAEREMEGVVATISSFSRVDGAIVLNEVLEVQGFGVELLAKFETLPLVRALDEHAETVQEIAAEGFGTRHRSVMRYCCIDQESVGFVVSQDGDIRAITWLEGKLVLWENIRLEITEHEIDGWEAAE